LVGFQRKESEFSLKINTGFPIYIDVKYA